MFPDWITSPLQITSVFGLLPIRTENQPPGRFTRYDRLQRPEVELLGGADIVEEMFDSGGLAEAHGVGQPEAVPAPTGPPPQCRR